MVFFMGLEVGTILEGKVTGITKFGVFVDLQDGKTGMVHISEVSAGYVNEIKDVVNENDVVKVKILSVSPEGKISLSMKQAIPKPERKPPQRNGSTGQVWSPPPKKAEGQTFEDMLTRYKQSSEERISEIRRATDGKRGYQKKRG